MTDLLNWTLWGVYTVIMLFSYWLVYCMGSPLADKPADVDPGAILGFIPRWLANRRLKQEWLLGDFRHALTEDLLATEDVRVRLKLRKDARLDALIVGREFFTWERSLLCPICLHWWLTVLVVLISLLAGWPHLYQPILQAALAYLLNHLVIRKIA